MVPGGQDLFRLFRKHILTEKIRNILMQPTPPIMFAVSANSLTIDQSC